jgi:3-methyladenine DNA glycosylase AlkC
MTDVETQKFKYYFNTQMAEQLARMIADVQPSFRGRAFVEQVSAQLDPLELKARVAVMADALRDFLPPAYPDAANILRRMMGPELPDETGMFNLGAHYAPVAYFVEKYGLDHVDVSLDMLYEVTKRHTAEYAIRPYIAQHTAHTLQRLRQWAVDPNAHVQRLVSEGSRPRLPWASRLDLFIRDPRPLLELLEFLRADPSAYVRKSVANALNDILKDNPAAAL